MGTALRTIDLDHQEGLESIVRVARAAGLYFDAAGMISSLKESSSASICIGAWVDGELAAFNTFLAHNVLVAGHRTIAYQIGWRATVVLHSGKGLFTRIMEEARMLLREKDGAFIFGFPDAASEPVLVREQGFSRLTMVRVVLPTAPGFLAAAGVSKQRFFECLRDQSIIRFNQYQTAAWKQRGIPGVVLVEDYTNMLWGLLEERRVPLLGKVKVLLAGGCEINKPQLIPQLMMKLRKEHGVGFVMFTATAGSMIGKAARLAFGGAAAESFVYFGLGGLPLAPRFDAHIGLKAAFR